MPRRKLMAIVLCAIAPAWLGLSLLQQELLQAGILNTKDLHPFIGHETGTLSEYLLNIWHWDGMLLLLMIAALPCLVFGVSILLSDRLQTKQRNTVS